MKKAIIIMACAAAALTGCQPADESGTITEPSGAERSGDTNGARQLEAGQSDAGTQSGATNTNSTGAGTSANP